MSSIEHLISGLSRFRKVRHSQPQFSATPLPVSADSQFSHSPLPSNRNPAHCQRPDILFRIEHFGNAAAQNRSVNYCWGVLPSLRSARDLSSGGNSIPSSCPTNSNVLVAGVLFDIDRPSEQKRLQPTTCKEALTESHSERGFNHPRPLIWPTSSASPLNSAILYMSYS
jgi:hypothetical protein